MQYLFSYPRKEKEKLVYFNLYFLAYCHLVAKKERKKYICYGKHTFVTLHSGVYHRYLSVYSRKLSVVHLGCNLCPGKSLFAHRGTYLI